MNTKLEALKRLVWDIEFAHSEGVGVVYNIRIEGDRLFVVVPLGENNAPHHVELKLVRVTPAPEPVEYKGTWASREQEEAHSYYSSEAYREHQEQVQRSMAEREAYVEGLARRDREFFTALDDAAEAERGRFVKDPDGGVHLVADDTVPRKDSSVGELEDVLREFGWDIPEEGR